MSVGATFEGGPLHPERWDFVGDVAGSLPWMRALRRPHCNLTCSELHVSGSVTALTLLAGYPRQINRLPSRKRRTVTPKLDPHLKRRTVLLVATALIATVALAACGSSSSGGGAAATTKTTAAVASGVDQTVAALVPAKIRAAGSLNVATGSGYAPFEFYGTDNKTLLGVDPDIVQAIGAILGLKVNLAKLQFDSIIPGLQSGRYDAGDAAMSVTPTRNKVVDFVSYFKGGTSLMVKSGSTLNLTLDNLCGHTIAAEKGTIYADDYLPKFSSTCTGAGSKAIKIGVYTDQPTATLAVQDGRADATMSDYGPLAYIAQQAGGKFEVLNINYKPSLYGIALPKGSTLAPAIEGALKALIANGTYEKILTKWQVVKGAITDPAISTNG